MNLECVLPTLFCHFPAALEENPVQEGAVSSSNSSVLESSLFGPKLLEVSVMSPIRSNHESLFFMHLRVPETPSLPLLM